MFWLTVALVAIGGVQALAALAMAWPNLLAATDKPSKKVAQATSVGRYQTVTTPTKTLMLDTATGQTSFQDADSVWKPLTTTESPENKARVVAELVAESLITTKTYNPSSGQFDTPTKAQKKEMVEAAVSKAFDAYAHSHGGIKIISVTPVR